MNNVNNKTNPYYKGKGKVKAVPVDDFNTQATPVPDPSPRDLNPNEVSGSNEDSYKAATRGTDKKP